MHGLLTAIQSASAFWGCALTHLPRFAHTACIVCFIFPRISTHNRGLTAKEKARHLRRSYNLIYNHSNTMTCGASHTSWVTTVAWLLVAALLLCGCAFEGAHAQCSGHGSLAGGSVPAAPARSCTELWLQGVRASGAHDVYDGTQMRSVYCDFSSRDHEATRGTTPTKQNGLCDGTLTPFSCCCVCVCFSTRLDTGRPRSWWWSPG